MGRSNLKNAVLAFLVPLPSILFYLNFLTHFQNSTTSLSPLWSWCFHHPLLLANALFFFNVNLLFWLISHIQSSNWVICSVHLFFSIFFFSQIFTPYIIDFLSLVPDDQFVLDGNTFFAGSLLCIAPFGAI